MLGWKKDGQRQPPRWYAPQEMAEVDLEAYDREMARYVADAFDAGVWSLVSALRLRAAIGVLGGPNDDN